MYIMKNHLLSNCLEMLEYEYVDPEEVNLVCDTAFARNQIKEDNHITSNKQAEDLTDLQIHNIGTGTEFPVIKVCGGTWDRFYGITPKGDGGIDTVIKDLTTQIRGRNRDDAWLYYNNLEDFKTDIAVLCEGKNLQDPKQGTIVRIVGWITKKDFISKHTLENYGRNGNGGWRCVCKPEHLSPIKELMNSKFVMRSTFK